MITWRYMPFDGVWTMKLTVLASGKLREEYAKLGAELYAKRIRKSVPLEVVEVPEPKGASASETGRKLAKRLRQDDRVCLLTDSGRELTSEEFASQVEAAIAGGHGRYVFVIGGPYGVGEELEGRADEKISFGRHTMPHELARVVLLEQIYRAITIIRRQPYHHG